LIDEAIRIKPNLRGYIANLIAGAAHEMNLPLRVVKGTQIIEISADQLKEEKKILENADIDDTTGVATKIKELGGKKKKNKPDKA
jgi:hypothetical protein